MTTFAFIILALLLTLLNAFFVAAEFSMIKIRSTRIELLKKEFGFRGKILATIVENLDAYLSSCQLGITLASLSLGWIGEPAFAGLIWSILDIFSIPISKEWIHFVGFIFGFAVISFLHIVAGELVPKSLAIRQSEFLAIWTAVPLYGFYKIMYPAIWFLNKCSELVIRVTRLDTSKKNRDAKFYSTDEIKLILHLSHLHGELTKEETAILKSTLDFADLQVSQIVKPLEELVVVNSNATDVEIKDFAAKHKFSRYPVLDKASGEYNGIIHIKNLVFGEGQGLENVMRPIIKVPYNFLAINLLEKFKLGKSHFAIVYDENNKPLGFVTLENLLSTMIGVIQDEFQYTKVGR